MKSHHPVVVAVLVAALAAAPCGGQPSGGTVVLTGDLGATVAGPVAGLGFTGGVARKWTHFQVGAALELIMGQSSDRTRYLMDAVGEGHAACATNSRTATTADVLCGGPRFTPGVLATVEYMPWRAFPLSFGTGYRMGETYGAIGSLTLTAPLKNKESRMRFSIAMGQQYWAFRFGVLVPVK